MLTTFLGKEYVGIAPISYKASNKLFPFRVPIYSVAPNDSGCQSFFFFSSSKADFKLSQNFLKSKFARRGIKTIPSRILHRSKYEKKSSKLSSKKSAACSASRLEPFADKNSRKMTILRWRCKSFSPSVSIHGLRESPRNIGVGLLKYRVSCGPSPQNVTIVERLEPRRPARPALCW